MKLKKLGARILWTLFFWGAATVLASSSYLALVKIGGLLRGGGAVQETAAVAPEDDEKMLRESAAVAPEDEGKMLRESVAVASEDGKKMLRESAAVAPEEDGEAARESATVASKYVALTFDDGPHRIYTPELLDGLAQRQVHATFFVIGKNIEGNEELIERMHQEGHVIGNHTYDHVKICDMSGPDACAQLEKTSALVREITGEDTEFVRPPFGAWNKEMECSFAMLPVLWDVDPLDWTTKNTAQVVERVLKDVKSGDIILLHDCYESSVEAALQIVDELQKQGYEFLTVDDMILE